ncbi:hypothetical protein DITRI_Ditri01bG0108100 [Diplodiscus trichospermus]
MCKGLQQGNTSSSCLKEGVSPDANRASGLVNCELCNSRASLYCQADDAYLCRKCDRWVHEANFLALRHIRRGKPASATDSASSSNIHI